MRKEQDGWICWTGGNDGGDCLWVKNVGKLSESEKKEGILGITDKNGSTEQLIQLKPDTEIVLRDEHFAETGALLQLTRSEWEKFKEGVILGKFDEI